MTIEEIEQWEKEVEAQKAENTKVIEGYRKWMQQNNLSNRAIDDHIFNIELFGNNYLVDDEVIPLEEAYEEMDHFLTIWYNRKVIAPKGAIKKQIASLKKFYTYLHEIKVMNDEDFEDMNMMIKTEKLNWLKTETEFFNRDW